MGVDYYTCASCTIGFRDDSELAVHCDCGNQFCSIKCGLVDNYGEWDEDRESYKIDDSKDVTCVICRKEKFTDYVLLEALLKHFNITREQAEEISRNQED